MHFNDIDNFYYEWDIEALPWDAVTPVPAGDEHPESLDQKLINAISEGPLKGLDDNAKSARAAALAFLYLYLILAKGGDRYVGFRYRGPVVTHNLIAGRRSILPRDRLSQSVQASALRRPFRHAQPQCYY